MRGNRNYSKKPRWWLLWAVLISTALLCDTVLAQSEVISTSRLIVGFGRDTLTRVRNETPELQSFTLEQIEAAILKLLHFETDRKLHLIQAVSIKSIEGKELDSEQASLLLQLLRTHMIKLVEPDYPVISTAKKSAKKKVKRKVRKQKPEKPPRDDRSDNRNETANPPGHGEKSGEDTFPPAAGVGDSESIMNDPHLRNGDLWGLTNPTSGINVERAWNVTTGDRQVVVGVVDTGIDYTHPDLRNNMWRNSVEIPGNGIDDDRNGYVDDVFGMNAIVDNGDPTDGNGHGTHVAGTIGAVTNNNLGVAGVAPNIRLMALKFLDDTGRGNTSDAVQAIEYALSIKSSSEPRLRVLNASWIGSGLWLEAAIQEAHRQGVVFVAAGGNEGRDTDLFPHPPASWSPDHPNIISVGATNSSGEKASFSNFGERTVDVFAPGDNILSTVPNGSYGWKKGTSMAAPHVSGVAALMFSLRPELSAEHVKQLLVLSADPKPSLVSRGGMVNAEHALHEQANLPPVWGEIPLQKISPVKGKDSKTILLPATEPEGEVMQFSAIAEPDETEWGMYYFRTVFCSKITWTKEALLEYTSKKIGWCDEGQYTGRWFYLDMEIMAILVQGQSDGKGCPVFQVSHVSEEVFFNPLLLSSVPEPKPIANATIVTSEGDEPALRVELIRKEYNQTFHVRVRATDPHGLFSETTATFSVVNSAPVLAELPDVELHWATENPVVDVPLEVEDVDDDEIFISTIIESDEQVAARLKTTYGLERNMKNGIAQFAISNLYGVPTKCFDGTYPEEESFRVCMTSTGEVHLQRDLQKDDEEVHVATISPWYYEDLARLFSASATSSTAPANSEITVAVDGRTILHLVVTTPTLPPTHFTVRVTASDGIVWQNRRFRVLRTNTFPSISSISNQTLPAGGSKVISFYGGDIDKDQVTIAARVFSPQGDAATFAASLPGTFLETSSISYQSQPRHCVVTREAQKVKESYYSNEWAGGFVRKVKKTRYITQNIDRSYCFNSRGEVQEYVLGKPSGKILATLDPSYFEQPELIFEEQESTGALPSVILAEGKLVVVAPPRSASPVSTSTAEITVSDGLASVKGSFSIVVTVYGMGGRSPTYWDWRTDTDGDGVLDAYELKEGTDLNDAGSYPLTMLGTESYGVWGNYLGANTLKVKNNATNYLSTDLTVSLLNTEAQTMGQKKFVIGAMKDMSIDLSTIPGFDSETLGLTKLLQGSGNGAGTYEASFGFALPKGGVASLRVERLLHGLSAVPTGDGAVSILALLNSGLEPLRFTIESYDAGGLQDSRSVTVPPGLLKLASSELGVNGRGYHMIIPALDDRSYDAVLIPRPNEKGIYRQRSLSRARRGTGIPLTLAPMEGARAVRVLNIAPERQSNVVVLFLNSQGVLVQSAQTNIDAFGEYSLTPPSGAASAVIIPSTPESLYAWSELPASVDDANFMYCEAEQYRTDRCKAERDINFLLSECVVE